MKLFLFMCLIVSALSISVKIKVNLDEYDVQIKSDTVNFNLKFHSKSQSGRNQIIGLLHMVATFGKLLTLSTQLLFKDC